MAELNMVERVAKAIHAGDAKGDYYAMARAAIEAIEIVIGAEWKRANAEYPADWESTFEEFSNRVRGLFVTPSPSPGAS